MKKRILLSLVILIVSCILFSCVSEKDQNDSDHIKSTEESQIYCEHVFSEWKTTDEPTCQKDGRRERKCSICNFSDIEYLAKLPHTMEKSEVYHPFCTEEGYTVYKCECGFSYTGDATAPT